MPYQLIKHLNGKFSVKNLDSGKIVAIMTTLEKAEAQIRLLNSIETHTKKYSYEK